MCKNSQDFIIWDKRQNKGTVFYMTNSLFLDTFPQNSCLDELQGQPLGNYSTKWLIALSKRNCLEAIVVDLALNAKHQSGILLELVARQRGWTTVSFDVGWKGYVVCDNESPCSWQIQVGDWEVILFNIGKSKCYDCIISVCLLWTLKCLLNKIRTIKRVWVGNAGSLFCYLGRLVL